MTLLLEVGMMPLLWSSCHVGWPVSGIHIPGGAMAFSRPSINYFSIRLNILGMDSNLWRGVLRCLEEYDDDGGTYCG